MMQCFAPNCPAEHMGKFDDCVAEALYELSLIDHGDATTGDAIDWDGYYTLFLLDDGEVVTIDPDGAARDVHVDAGGYILECLPSGAVYAQHYPTPEEATEAFSLIHAAYEMFNTDIDDDTEDQE